MITEDKDYIKQELLDLKKGVLEFSYISIKSLILINGGAIVALLTLMGTIWKDGTEKKLVECVLPNLMYFNVGIILAVLSCLLAYIFQVLVTETFIEEYSILKKGLRGVAVIGVFVSLGCFAIGSYRTLSAISSHLNNPVPTSASVKP